MKFNQIVKGLENNHTYRLESWPELKYIQRGEDDTIQLHSPAKGERGEWVPTWTDAFEAEWLPVNALIAAGPTPVAESPQALRKLECLPKGEAIRRTSGSGATDVLYFDPTTERLKALCIDDHGQHVHAAVFIFTLTQEGWMHVEKNNTPTAPTPPTSEEEPMKIANRAEIAKLCEPLQKRLRENTAFVRIEIPVADVGFEVGGQDASLLISITAESVEFHAHVDGVELLDFPAEDGFTINRRLIEGPIASRENKPLSAIAVPLFMIRPQDVIPPANPLPTEHPVGVAEELSLSYDPSFKINGVPDIQYELGTYHPINNPARYFEVIECRGGMVIGRFFDDAMKTVSALTGDLFETFFVKLSKVTKGMRLKNTKVGTEIVISEVGDETAIVDIDLGSVMVAGEMPLDQLRSDEWIFVEFLVQAKTA